MIKSYDWLWIPFLKIPQTETDDWSWIPIEDNRFAIYKALNFRSTQWCHKDYW